MSDSVRPHRQQPTRLRCPWDSPGKNTGVGCHFLLQCMKVKSESEVAQSCLTLCNPMDCSPSSSSIHGIFQARVLEWVAIAFSDMKHYKMQLSKWPDPQFKVGKKDLHSFPTRRSSDLAPVFLPGESQGQRSLVGCCLWGRTESDTTEVT